MRIMIKGGVWKNTEDEILKAAVMKYGKNQWARISSLLVRKSAKQCKARWYEWLDPSIKKTEWTREEDEKLLHLAKLMPTQWRTIAPIVGRTPSQCLERYEKLLDAACSKDENYEASDDPRKLRPGEIDPNPESKPARPDPVDMDEDEKEMLSEARARLANTRGKKAKRKAREKQLEEARRLASLQKRRELKAAGINNRHRKRKRRGIDYNAEIPFEKRPPPGFYDVADEDKPVVQPSFPTTIEELEGKRRVDVEAQLRKQDIARNKIAERKDAPSAILQANKLNDPEAVRKRSKLMLPSPQITDQELEEIAKMGYATDLVLGSEELRDGSGATRTLLANYSQTPRQGMTPLRTPQRTPVGKADAIMMEAENLARLRESQTPLLGGDNPELHPSDFSGVTPKKREIQTPNPMATPLATPGHLTPRFGMTPSRDGYTYGLTPKGTPFRDDLHINEDIEMQDAGKLELHRQAELKRNLRSGLSNLPQPKNEYQIVAQPIPDENEETEERIEEDMSDRIAREKAQEQARQEALLMKRSKVLQRELPRPPANSLELIRNSLARVGEDKSSFVPPTLFEQADEMINKELLALLEHDNAKYPLDGKAEKEKKKGNKRVGSRKPSGSVPEIEDFDDDELKEAHSLIEQEILFLRVAMGHESESPDDFGKARDACQEDLMYFPSRNTYGLASVAGNSDKLAALQNEFEILKKRMDDEASKATRLEQKIKLLTHGYQVRGGNLWSQIEATHKQMDTAATELECFQALHKQELSASSYRVNNLIEEVNKQNMLERSLQNRYGDLIGEYDRIQRLLEGHRIQLQKQEEIAAKNRAIEEEIAAKNRALEEEIAAKNRALEEEFALKHRNAEEEIAAKSLAVEENIAANRCDVLEELTPADRARGEDGTVRNRDSDDGLTCKTGDPNMEVSVDVRGSNTGLNKTDVPNSSYVCSTTSEEPVHSVVETDLIAEILKNVAASHGQTTHDQGSIQMDRDDGRGHIGGEVTDGENKTVDSLINSAPVLVERQSDAIVSKTPDVLPVETFKEGDASQSDVRDLNSDEVSSLGSKDKAMIVDSNSQLPVVSSAELPMPSIPITSYSGDQIAVPCSIVNENLMASSGHLGSELGGNSTLSVQTCVVDELRNVDLMSDAQASNEGSEMVSSSIVSFGGSILDSANQATVDLVGIGGEMGEGTMQNLSLAVPNIYVDDSSFTVVSEQSSSNIEVPFTDAPGGVTGESSVLFSGADILVPNSGDKLTHSVDDTEIVDGTEVEPNEEAVNKANQ